MVLALTAPPAGFEPATRGLGMLTWAPPNPPIPGASGSTRRAALRAVSRWPPAVFDARAACVRPDPVIVSAIRTVLTSSSGTLAGPHELRVPLTDDVSGASGSEQIGADTVDRQFYWQRIRYGAGSSVARSAST
jgi:hypothetical protein